MGEIENMENLALDAMRLAEQAHCTRLYMRDMNRLLVKGHPASAFTKQDHATQLNKFESLYSQVFEGHVPETIAARYQAALLEFRSYGK